MPGRSECLRLLAVCLLAGAAAPLGGAPRGAVAKPAELKVIELKQKDGQILSYRHATAATEVTMRGTRLAPDARIRLKVQSRPGFVEVDINRGAITGLKPATRLGKDFLTYVMWAVSVDGRASNLGEITFAGQHPVSINVTTSYQTFWLMVTAEPDYAVVDPSPQVVLYSAGAEGSERGALGLGSDLFFYTHFTTYDSSPASPGAGPSELLQARKAVELASQSGVLAVEGAAGGSKEEERARETLKQAKAFLTQAENGYRTNPHGSEVPQLARTSSQIAENARALAQGAVGGASIRQLQNEVAALRAQAGEGSGESVPPPVEPPTPPVETKPAEPALGLASNPVTWFGLLGWGLALLLLFRRRPT